MAKELVRIRGQKDKILSMKVQMGAVGHRTTTMAATAAMGEAMKGTASVMTKMNKAMDPAAMQKTTMAFAKESEMMGMKEEMLDDLFDDEDVEDESTEVLEQVFDEIGLDASGKLVSVPKSAPVSESAVKERAKKDEDLESLLAQLK
eukprot:TRINITY_DN2243_c0_g1_i6.p2 TRINITY_DN2243_c0_g1~~TRINITY_DN2243_c0_g1_i6.p2  ORF type:complete len:147 (+),score=17.25 TRINITY_DN2243_c0_g1_i6:204-644(+)